MFVFGGKDDESEKLNDLWSFNMASQIWSKIGFTEGQTCPIPRSGHSADVYGNFMVIFGGIRDVIREMNDLHVYSFEKSCWTTI